MVSHVTALVLRNWTGVVKAHYIMRRLVG